MIKDIGQSFNGKIIESPADLAHGEIGIDRQKRKAYIKIGDSHEEIAIGDNINEAIEKLMGRISAIKEIYVCPKPTYVPPTPRPKRPPRQCPVPITPIPHPEQYLIDQSISVGYTDAIWIYDKWGKQPLYGVFWLITGCGRRRRLCASAIPHPRGSAEAIAHIQYLRNTFAGYGIELREEDLSYMRSRR